MHWKPLTCWITALHPHVFRLFWFASSPRTSVQTHFQKKKGKKKEYPRRQSLSGNHNKCNVCLWNTHESFISAPGHESHTTASLWWISSLAFTFCLNKTTFYPFKNAGRTEEKDGLLWFQKYEKFVRPSFDTMQTHFCFISRFLGAWIPSTVKYTINWDGEPLAFWYVVTYFFMCG